MKLDEQNGKLEAEICIEENFILGTGLNLEFIAENAEIFKRKKKTVPANKIATVSSVDTKLVSLEAGVSKLGEIKDKNGKKIVFYKNSEGKIKKIMEEKE